MYAVPMLIRQFGRSTCKSFSGVVGHQCQPVSARSADDQATK
jgi:hypothetical protein